MNEKINYWLDLSDYDFETAEAMQKSGRYLYVGFMCHQAIEKALKACHVSKKNDTPPFTHSLSYLAKKADLYNLFSEEQKNFLDSLEPLNIEARYPSHKAKLMQSLTEVRCSELLKRTKELQQWIKTKL